MGLKKVLIMAGGTGGHVFPALAVAKALRARGVTVLWLGTRGRLEEKVVPAEHFQIQYLKVRGIRRNGIMAHLSAPFIVLREVCRAATVIRKFAPDVVFGLGGYASGPGGVAARLCGAKLALHEQNAAPGFTNRVLHHLAQVSMTGFPDTFKGGHTVDVGNPVRREIMRLTGLSRSYRRGGALRVLVLGGSLGAQALNEALPQALAELKLPLEVTHQCGQGHGESVMAAYAGAPFAVRVQEFITDMAAAYTEADAVICRAGALTVAEVACAALPALFIPLPTAVDDHQAKNAMFMCRSGAALMLRQEQFGDGRLAQTLAEFLGDREKLAAMSAAAAKCARPEATARVIAELEALAGGTDRPRSA